ncbi:MAG: hypothetical protein R6V14_08250, partial [Halanaerobiales bacterium]
RNPETGNYGPSWDMRVQLPVVDQEYSFADLSETEEFASMGLSTNEEGDDIDSFFIRGTEEKPIQKTTSFPLPELSVNLDNGIDEQINSVPIQNGSEDRTVDTIPFPSMTLGSTGNTISVEVYNAGSNSIDDLTIEIWDKNSNEDQPIDTVNFTNLSGENEKDLILNNAKIENDDFELRIAYEQSSGVTEANLSIAGMQEITIQKVENLDVGDVSKPNFDDISVEMGIFEEINEYDSNPAELKLAITPPSSMNMDFVFDSLTLSGNSYDEIQNDYYVWTGTTIPLGTLSASGSLTLPDGGINYDASDSAEVDVVIKGEAEITKEEQISEDIYVENGDLVYETQPNAIEITQEDIDTIREGQINLEETYLQSTINNQTDLDYAAEIYISSSSDESILYNEANKVSDSDSLLYIEAGENPTRRFLLKDSIDRVEEALTEGNVYLGFKFITGDLDQDGGIDIEFSDEDSLDITSFVSVKVGINQ